MRKIISFIAMTILTVFFVGCRVQYIPVPVQTQIDSSYVEHIEERKDTVGFELPSEKIYVVRQDSSHLETAVAISDAVVDSLGFLHHSLVNKDVKLEKEIVYKDRIIEKKVEIEKEVPVITEVEKKVEVVPEYYKKINIIFWSLVSGLLLGFVIFIMVKFKVF
jgi:hypothetical protein